MELSNEIYRFADWKRSEKKCHLFRHPLPHYPGYPLYSDVASTDYFARFGRSDPTLCTHGTGSLAGRPRRISARRVICSDNVDDFIGCEYDRRRYYAGYFASHPEEI